MTDDEALSLGSSAASLVSQVVSQDMEESYVANVEYQGGDPVVYEKAFESWRKAQPDIGDFLGVGKLISNTMQIDVLGNVKEGTIEVELLGTSHDAILEILCENGDISSITTNVNYSFAENMEKAGLNTLLGMGTVFCVLILISLIISMFNLIPKIQNAFKKKPETSQVEKAVDGAIAQIVKQEEAMDDSELVAVISAAIAAYEAENGGSASSDGFVVRSIKKRTRKWARV